MRRTLAFLPLLCALALSCRDRPSGPAPARSAAPRDGFDGLTVDLTPDPDRGVLVVGLRLSGPRAASTNELAVARAWAGTHGETTVGAVYARDDLGDLPVEIRPADGGPDRLFALGRAPQGDLLVRYQARANAEASSFALRVQQDRMSGVGHAFLLLPRLPGSVPTRLRWHTAALGRGADAASSLGFGAEVTAPATTEELSHAVYVAGKLWLEEDAKDAGDRVVMLGNPAIDGRSALAQSILIEAHVANVFDPRAPATRDRFTFFFVAEPGLGRGEDGAYLTRSLGVWFDAGRPLDASLRIVVAHELAHRFLGGEVRLVEPGGAEAAWFTEGFAVHFAREALLESTLITPAEFAADLRRTLGDASGSLPESYRRGARWAAALDAAVRRASKGARSLRDVVRDLVARARREQQPALPVAALREALGAEAGGVLDRLSARPDAPVDVPRDAFGPCFRRIDREVRVFELGFDRAAVSGGPAAVVRDLVPGSAAEKAGVRAGALVLSAKVPFEQAALGEGKAEVQLLLAERQGSRKVHYRPVATRHETDWEPTGQSCR
jgi:predicted metalloprotease with PDZ domain